MKVEEVCKFCSGRGWTLDKWTTCPKCNGTGKIKTIKHTNPECPCYMLDKQSGVSKSHSIGKGSPNGTPKNQIIK